MSNVTSCFKTTKATSVSTDGEFFMEILDGTNKIEKIDFVSSSGGAIKDWTLEDSLVVKKEDGENIVFKIHGNKGPVYLVTEKNLGNGKTKKFRVTFYIPADGILVKPKKITLPKTGKIVSVKSSNEEVINDTHDYVMTDQDRGYDSNGKPVLKEGEPMRAFNQRMAMWANSTKI